MTLHSDLMPTRSRPRCSCRRTSRSAGASWRSGMQKAAGRNSTPASRARPSSGRDITCSGSCDPDATARLPARGKLHPSGRCSLSALHIALRRVLYSFTVLRMCLCEVALEDELVQQRLQEEAVAHVAAGLARTSGMDKRRRAGDPADAQAGQEALAERADVDHVAARVHRLQRRRRLAFVAQQAAPVVLDHRHAMPRRQAQQSARAAPATS